MSKVNYIRGDKLSDSQYRDLGELDVILVTYNGGEDETVVNKWLVSDIWEYNLIEGFEPVEYYAVFVSSAVQSEDSPEKIRHDVDKARTLLDRAVDSLGGESASRWYDPGIS